MNLRCLTLLGAIACTSFRTGPAASISAEFTTPRGDGSRIEWSLDRQRGGSRQGILLIAQGSGCAAASDNANVVRAKTLLPEFAALTVEKYGVRRHDSPKDPIGGCSPEFYAHHTVSQRVADYERVLAELEKSSWWDGRLVLFGGSEGGAAVSMLAPRVRPTAVVIFSTAPGRSFRETFKLAVPPHVAAQADAEFARIEADPLSPKLWGGNSYRWWADILDHDLTADLLAVRAPILLVHGELDRSAPVQVARMVRDDFQRQRRCNLTYWELPGYDHLMRDGDGVSHLDEVMQRIADWLASKLGGSPRGRSQ